MKELIKTIITENKIDIIEDDIKNIYEKIRKDNRIVKKIAEIADTAETNREKLKEIAKNITKILEELRKEEICIQKKLINSTSTLADIDSCIFAAGYVQKNRKKINNGIFLKKYTAYKNDKVEIIIYSSTILDEKHKTILDAILLHGKERKGREVEKQENGEYIQRIIFSISEIKKITNMNAQTIKECIADMQNALISIKTKIKDSEGKMRQVTFNFRILDIPVSVDDKIYYVKLTEEYMIFWKYHATIDYSYYTRQILSAPKKIRKILRVLLSQRGQKRDFQFHVRTLISKYDYARLCETCEKFDKKNNCCTEEIKKENNCRITQNQVVEKIKKEIEKIQNDIDIEVEFKEIDRNKIKENKNRRKGVRTLKDYLIKGHHANSRIYISWKTQQSKKIKEIAEIEI